jgi:hypothetical protein
MVIGKKLQLLKRFTIAVAVHKVADTAWMKRRGQTGPGPSNCFGLVYVRRRAYQKLSPIISSLFAQSALALAGSSA